MRYSELISEAKVVAQGILRGPTSSDMAALCARDDYRGITYNDKVYIAKAYQWTHHAMAEELGIGIGYDYDIFYATTNERNEDESQWDDDAWMDGSEPSYDHPKGFIIFGGDRSNAGFNLMIKGAQLAESLEDPRLDDEDNRTRGSRAATMFRYYDENNIGFRVMDHKPDRHAPERPLAVVIHPGDMINHFFGSMNDLPEDERELARQSIRFGSENQAGMQKELAELRRKGYDFVVLHRESSVQYPENKIHETRKKVWIELQAGHKRGTMLFGDDLDRAGRWMIANLHIEDRPHVYLLGAYSDPEVGCLTHIGQQFAQVLDPSKITVSRFSPVSDDPSEQHKAWRPIEESFSASDAPVDDVAMHDLLAPCGQTRTIGTEKGRYNPDGISVYRSPHGSTRYVYSGAGESLAVLQIMSRNRNYGTIANAYTVEKARRNGLASKLLDRARKDFKSVKHSDSLSSDGAAWANAVENL